MPGFRVIYVLFLTFLRIPKGALRLVPLALHAGLSTDEQLMVFQKADQGTRKVIVSTNIAEV
jgi:ATP-dependent RNA helicase DDX35